MITGAQMRIRRSLAWLTTINISDRDAQRRGRVAILLACGMIGACILAIPVALSVAARDRALLSLLFGAIFYLAAIIIVRRGRVDLGALVIIFPTTLIIFGSMIFAGGLQIRPLYLVLSVLLASMLLPPRGVWIVALINLLAFALAYLLLQGTLLPEPLGSQIITATVIIISITALVGSLGANSMRAALMQADRAQQELQAANAELRARIQERERADARFTTIFNTSPLGITITSLTDGRFIDMNPSFEKLTGRPRDEMLGHPMHRLPLWAEPIDHDHLIAAAYSTTATAIESRYRTADGGLRDVLISLEPIELNGERCLLAIYLDITDRIRAEAALRTANERFELAAAVVHAVIYEWDLEHNRVVRSQGLTSVLGYARDEVMTSDNWWTTNIHPEDAPGVWQHIATVLANGAMFDIEYRFRHHDGSYRHISDHGIVIRHDDGRAIRIVGSMQDITERRRLEAQYVQSQKLESIGRLAGGVAHDFNNLLTVISGNAALARSALPADHTAAADLQSVLDASQRAARLVQQLLAFARKQLLEPKILDLNQVFADIHDLLQRLVGSTITITMELRSDVGMIRADPTQIEQVLINLIVNARDAMANGGMITVTTANALIDEAYAVEHVGAQPGRYVLFTVSDTGSGIPPAIRARLFEPFFTTKEVGHGTGLGLATCYGIVKQHGGSIWCESEEGRGTTFLVYLPRIDGRPEESSTHVDAPIAHVGGTVLVAEDDAAVRSYTARILRGWGYTVLEAADGVEAIAAINANPAPVRLAIADVIMPRMNGVALAEQLLAQHPEMRIIFTSGYSERDALPHTPEAPPALLEKPFSPEELAQRIQQVLNA
jgi:PAS domain S-box-containing protein